VGNSTTGQVLGILLLLTAAAGVLAAVLLARRNWKLGRIDRKGAFRIGAARALMGMIVWIGRVHAVPSSDMIVFAISTAAAALAWGAGFWLLYLALEPAVRAHWPHSIVTWNRLIAGRWTDAQVASHILIGAAVGATVWTAASLLDLFSGTGMGSLSGLDAVGLLSFFALTGLRQLVKRDWVAAAIAAMFFTLTNSTKFTSANWQVKTAIYLFLFSVLLWVLLRYGLVTIIAACFFIDTFDALGLGSDWKAWYAPAGIATLTLLAGIAIYTFWRSQGSSQAYSEAAG